MNTQPNMLYDTYKYYELYDVIGEEKLREMSVI